MKKIYLMMLFVLFLGCVSRRYAYLENSTSDSVYFYFKEMKDKSSIIKPNEKALLLLVGGGFAKR